MWLTQYIGSLYKMVIKLLFSMKSTYIGNPNKDCIGEKVKG